jgi:hypothetical protein
MVELADADAPAASYGASGTGTPPGPKAPGAPACNFPSEASGASSLRGTAGAPPEWLGSVGE